MNRVTVDLADTSITVDRPNTGIGVSVPGAQGPPGPAGADGAQGPAGPEGPPGPAGASATRQTTTITTASLANNTQETGTVTLAKSYRLLRLTTNTAARVRVYSTTAKRDADAARAIGTDPTGDHGLMLEHVTTASMPAADLSPTVDGFNGETTPGSVIPYTITNLSGASSVVTATLTWIGTEQE